MLRDAQIRLAESQFDDCRQIGIIGGQLIGQIGILLLGGLIVFREVRMESCRRRNDGQSKREILSQGNEGNQRQCNNAKGNHTFATIKGLWRSYSNVQNKSRQLQELIKTQNPKEFPFRRNQCALIVLQFQVQERNQYSNLSQSY